MQSTKSQWMTEIFYGENKKDFQYALPEKSALKVTENDGKFINWKHFQLYCTLLHQIPSMSIKIFKLQFCPFVIFKFLDFIRENKFSFFSKYMSLFSSIKKNFYCLNYLYLSTVLCERNSFIWHWVTKEQPS